MYKVQKKNLMKVLSVLDLVWGKEHYVTFEVSFGTSLVLSLF